MHDQIKDMTTAPFLRAGAAIRRDSAVGIEERVGFVGPVGERIFACLHRPLDAPKIGLLVCSPLFSDFRSNYRREVMLGRVLAERGVAALRFHYRGTGNSDGLASEVTVDSLVRDARDAASVLRHEIGDRPLGVVGTRLGALVAAGVVASSPPRAPLILWEPELNAPSYFRQGFRAASMQAIKEQREDRSPAAIISELHQRGWTDLMGYHLSSVLYEGLTNSSAREMLGEVARRVLIVQFRQSEALRKDVSDLVLALSERGHEVDAEMAGVEGNWWFVPNEDLSEEHVVSTTLDWLERTVLGVNGEA